ncbi:hypothetical protein [Alcanivorax sp.]|uniref:hypothetical protein n=1 Tax=Alcanivorax sp. TaxID=1872427 RepID=UPI0025BB83C8|nr:hypothetical protein [Alcanivorax sp.]
MKIVTFIAGLLLSGILSASPVAQCFSPKGYTYYPEIGHIGQDSAGWKEDQISQGKVTLVKDADGKFDILFIDASETITSSRADGGTVAMVSRGKGSASFVVLYPGKTVETYTFVETTSGALDFMMTTSRSGDNVVFTKATVMVGNCSYINFEEL